MSTEPGREVVIWDREMGVRNLKVEAEEAIGIFETTPGVVVSYLPQINVKLFGL